MTALAERALMETRGLMESAPRRRACKLSCWRPRRVVEARDTSETNTEEVFSVPGESFNPFTPDEPIETPKTERNEPAADSALSIMEAENGDLFRKPDEFIAHVKKKRELNMKMTMEAASSVEEAQALALQWQALLQVSPVDEHTPDRDTLRIVFPVAGAGTLTVQPLDAEGNSDGEKFTSEPNTINLAVNLLVLGTFHLLHDGIHFVPAGYKSRLQVDVLSHGNEENAQNWKRQCEALETRNRKLHIRLLRRCAGCGVLFLSLTAKQIYHDAACANRTGVKNHYERQKQKERAQQEEKQEKLPL